MELVSMWNCSIFSIFHYWKITPFSTAWLYSYFSTSKQQLLEMNLKNAQQFSKLAQRKHFPKLQWVFLLMLHNGNTSNENIGILVHFGSFIMTFEPSRQPTYAFICSLKNLKKFLKNKRIECCNHGCTMWPQQSQM